MEHSLLWWIDKSYTSISRPLLLYRDCKEHTHCHSSHGIAHCLSSAILFSIYFLLQLEPHLKTSHPHRISMLWSKSTLPLVLHGKIARNLLFYSHTLNWTPHPQIESRESTLSCSVRTSKRLCLTEEKERSQHSERTCTVFHSGHESLQGTTLSLSLGKDSKEVAGPLIILCRFPRAWWPMLQSHI